MLEHHIDKLKTLLAGLLDSSLSEMEFKPLYIAALKEYEEYIGDRPYWPLKDLIDMWGTDLHKYSSQALERLPREELDRSTKKWIRENLVTDEAFDFRRFDEKLQLYKSDIDCESFLLSALNGTLKPLPFKFADLLQSLKQISGEELASWVICTEPDGAFTVIESIWSLGKVYEDPGQLTKIEQIKGSHVQWGDCYQLLLPKSKKWALVNFYNFREFEISVYGDKEFLNKVKGFSEH